VKVTHLSLAQALKRDPSPGNLAAEMAAFGATEVEFYAPKGSDPQTPHDRDEFYFVARGSGILSVAGELFPFSAGDLLFVPAHAVHHFVEFSADFATWVLFL